MGNEPSKGGKQSKSATIDFVKKSDSHDRLAENAFNKLSGSSNGLKFDQLKEIFGEDLSESLWNYFTNNRSRDDELRREDFHNKFAPLAGSSTDVYVKLLQPVYHFVKVCSETAGAKAVQGDELFIKNLVEKMTKGQTGEAGVNAILEWRRSSCERICNSVQSVIIEKTTGQNFTRLDYSSDILTAMQMWYLKCCLPSIYFPVKDKEVGCSGTWSPLYTSLQHGISTNRFETLVFDYKGPTVSIFRMQDKRIVAIATDQEWRHSGNRFGGPYTCFFELYPNLRRIDEPCSIYCNLKLRMNSLGISFLNELKIDKDFDQVLDIEVWGCAPENTLAEQQKLKNWQKQQAERNKKVPLPGNWDDNPDKTLLEMAGFQFSQERQLMEMEARQKKECGES